MLLHVFVLWVAVAMRGVESLLSDAPDRKYEARCEVSGDGREDGVGLPCQCSLFSYYNFEVTGTVGMLPESCDLCSVSGDECRRAGVQVAAVLRGGCSFDTKATNAKKLGYHALVVVNNSPNEAVFPMGAKDSDYASSIPIVMMHHDSREYLASSEVIKMVLDHAKHPHDDQYGNDGGYKIVDSLPTVLQYCGPAILICLVLLVSTPFKLQWLGGETRHHVLTALLAALFLLMRIGTFRRMQAGAGTGEGSSEYHHQETDERIFAALVDTIERNFWDYSLHSSGVIPRLGLSLENYGDSIFIHPPLFVYTLYALKAWLGLPLPASVLLLQVATLLLVRQLTLLVATRFGTDLPSARSTALMAMAIYASCPLAALCSQKIWIDNMLLFASCLCSYGHLWLWMPVSMSPSLVSGSGAGSSATGTTSISADDASSGTALQYGNKALASGLAFGLLVLNCKVTGLALLPFLVLTMAYSVWIAHANTSTQGGTNISALPVLARLRLLLRLSAGPVSMFLLGALCSHGPWLWCYYRATGRLLPNAWPSPALIARHPFLQRAIAHPPHYYLATLLRFSPVMLVGLLAAAVRPLVVWYAHKKTRVGSRSEVRKAWWCVCLAVWPASFLAGLTLLGVCGAGYQARFLLPLVPATAVLSALHLTTVTSASTGAGAGTIAAVSGGPSPSKGKGKGKGTGSAVSAASGDGSAGAGAGEDCAESEASVKGTVLALLLCYSSMHVLYYSVLLPTLYADLDASLLDVVGNAITYPYTPVPLEPCGRELLTFLRHLGIRLD